MGKYSLNIVNRQKRSWEGNGESGMETGLDLGILKMEMGLERRLGTVASEAG
jgi:hypothetical protein